MFDTVIFSDLHLGRGIGASKNDTDRLKDACDSIDQIIKFGKDNNVSRIAYLGDFFHSRESINTLVINTAQDKIEELCFAFEEVIFVPGNHDYYENNTNNVSSTSMFRRIANLKIVDKQPLGLLSESGKRIVFVPWKFGLEDAGRYDVMMGHFEFNGGVINGRTISGLKTSPVHLHAVAPLVFSGHYHSFKEYESENGKIVVVGCPYEQDWNDCGSPKGFVLFDSSTLAYQFVPISGTPKHLRIPYGKIKALTDEQLETVFTKLKGNFIKIDCSTGAFDYDVLHKIVGVGAKYSRSIEPEYGSIAGALGNASETTEKPEAYKQPSEQVKDFVAEKLKEERFAGLSESSVNGRIDKYFAMIGE